MMMRLSLFDLLFTDVFTIILSSGEHFIENYCSVKNPIKETFLVQVISVLIRISLSSEETQGEISNSFHIG